MQLNIRTAGPHNGQPVLETGSRLEDATAAGILLHGRGATAAGILDLAHALTAPRMAWLAPQAAGDTWYPNRFLAPIASNEPWLSSALAAVVDLVARIAEAGLPRDRVLIAGFSQGACLALEFVIRHPARYGGVAGLSGGLIGPPGTVWPDVGSLEGSPIFLGCSDVDAHIPAERILESATVLKARGANVTSVLYPGMDHTINRDELDHVQTMIDQLDAPRRELSDRRTGV
jgi:predicted esterase